MMARHYKVPVCWLLAACAPACLPTGSNIEILTLPDRSPNSIQLLDASQKIKGCVRYRDFSAAAFCAYIHTLAPKVRVFFFSTNSSVVRSTAGHGVTCLHCPEWLQERRHFCRANNGVQLHVCVLLVPRDILKMFCRNLITPVFLLYVDHKNGNVCNFVKSS